MNDKERLVKAWHLFSSFSRNDRKIKNNQKYQKVKIHVYSLSTLFREELRLNTAF